MSDQTLVPADPAKLNVRQQQVIKVLQIMVDGSSQAEACALVGISQRTYQRWVSKPEMGRALQQLAQDAMTAAAVAAFNAFPAAVAYQVEIATGKAGDPRDANKSAVFLRDLAQAYMGATKGGGKSAPTGESISADDGESASVTLTFTPKFLNQKLNVSSEVSQPATVIEGHLSETEDEDQTREP